MTLARLIAGVLVTALMGAPVLATWSVAYAEEGEGDTASKEESDVAAESEPEEEVADEPAVVESESNVAEEETPEPEPGETEGEPPSEMEHKTAAETVKETPKGDESVNDATTTVKTTAADVGSAPTPTATSTASGSSMEPIPSTTPVQHIGTDTPATTTDVLGSPPASHSHATGTGTTTIETGSAIALANVLNLVNSNFINSSGVVVFKNFFETLLDDLDLRDFYEGVVSAGCSLLGCASDEVTTNIKNDAIVENELYVEAQSGSNTIDGTGHAVIETGDAYAGVNLVNVVNTNVIDSNYLLVTVNAFQDVDGDIVFPGLAGFFNSLGGAASPNAVSITDSAAVENDVALTAGSGGNSVETNGGGTIKTGDSAGSGNVFNELNTSLVGGQNIALLFRVHGSWAGEIFGAPDNLAWMDDGAGGIYVFDKGGTGGGNVTADNLTVNATNSASVKNKVNVVALTGDNAITGAETALISTGNAYAGANIMNVANATVVGRNWILAVINIFGDFNGNIAFGRPDLWVGGQATLPRSVKDGSEIEYKTTVINNGDSRATDVVLRSRYDAAHLETFDPSLPYDESGAGEHVWKLPDLEPGQAVEITYYGRLTDTDYGMDVTNTMAVSSHEKDNNMVDNTEDVVVTTDSHNRGNGVRISLSDGGKKTKAAPVSESEYDVRILRTPFIETVDTRHEGRASEELVITNESGETLKGVIIHDILHDQFGLEVGDEMWSLGDIGPHEEVRLTYDIDFNGAAPLGLYGFDTAIEIGNGADIRYAKSGSIALWRSPEIAVLTDDRPVVPSMVIVSPDVLGASDVAPAPIGVPEESSDDIAGLVTTQIAHAAEAPMMSPGEPRKTAASSYIVLAYLLLLGMTYSLYRFDQGIDTK